MADNKEIKGAQDFSKINLEEQYEVQYWTKKFGCTKNDLTDAVNSVGNSAASVSEYLEMLSGKKK